MEKEPRIEIVRLRETCTSGLSEGGGAWLNSQSSSPEDASTTPACASTSLHETTDLPLWFKREAADCRDPIGKFAAKYGQPLKFPQAAFSLALWIILSELLSANN